MIFRYLNNRTQRVKINKTFSSWREFLPGLPRAPALGAILSNMYLNDLFLFLNKIDVCNFDNDTTPFMCHKNFAKILEKLERNSELVIHWFEDNYINLALVIVIYLNLVINMNIGRLK